MEISSHSKAYGLGALQQLFKNAEAKPTLNGQVAPGGGQNPPSTTQTSGFGPTWNRRSASALIALQGDVRLGANVASDLVKSLDNDKNGVASLEEIQDAWRSAGRNVDMSQAFASVDANEDGKIAADELANSFAARPPPVPQGEAPARHGLATAITPFDQDGDEALNLDEIASALGKSDAEAVAVLEPQFSMLDGNGDGKIDVAEFGAALRSLWETALKAYGRG